MIESSSQHRSDTASILIILMGSLGDLIRGLCVASHIKNNRPHSRVTWLVEPQWAELVRRHPHIDEMIVFDRPRHVAGVLALKKELAARHFDITLDLQRHLKSGFFSLLSRARKRVGFHPRNAKEFNWLFNTEHIDYYPDDLPKLDHYLKFTEHLNLPQPEKLDFGFSWLNDANFKPGALRGLHKKAVAMVMGSSWKSKDWTREGYIQLASRVLAWGTHAVILLGDRSQTEAAGMLRKTINSPDLINLTGRTSLVELAAALRFSSVAVGPDSGPGHMASAVGTPYVSLFGPTSPQRVAPYKSEHLVIAAGEQCAPCYKKSCPGKGARCMANIRPADVEGKLIQALKEAAEKNSE